MNFKFLYLLLLLLISFELAAQMPEDSVQVRISAAWSAVANGGNTAEAERLAGELLEIDAEQGHPLAKANAYQIIGEVQYWTTSIDSAIYWYKKALQTSIETGLEEEVAHTQVSLASLNKELGLYNKADSLYLKGLEIWKTKADTNNILFIQNFRGWNRMLQEMHYLAMEIHLEAYNIARAARDTFYMAASLEGIGVIHKKQKNYDLSAKATEEAKALYSAIGEVFSVAGLAGNYAMTLKSMGHHKEAHRMLREECKPLFLAENYRMGLLSTYGNMAVCSNLMGKHEQALQEIDSAFVYGENLDRAENKSDLYNEKAKALLALGNFSEGLTAVERAIDFAQGTSLEKLRDARLTKSRLLESMDRNEEALAEFQSYAQLNDSILTKEKARAVLELETVYETAEKRREIDRLESESVLAETKRKGLIGGLAAIIFLSAIIINREIEKRKKEKKLHQTEIKLAEADKVRLEDQLAFKKRELTAMALEIARKNELMEDIKSDLLLSDRRSEMPGANEVYKKIDFNSKMDKNWEQFIEAFKSTNGDFLHTLAERYPDLSKSEIRLSALIKMNLSSKDIASILNISDEGVKKARYRLRKKLQLEPSDSLEHRLLSIA